MVGTKKWTRTDRLLEMMLLMIHRRLGAMRRLLALLASFHWIIHGENKEEQKRTESNLSQKRSC
jgi:hypothetical protein